jgi:hypothetical protein
MGAIVSIEKAVFLDHLRRFDEPHVDRALVVATPVAFAITSNAEEARMNVALILVSLVGLLFLDRRTCSEADRPNSTWLHSRSQISEARRPCRKAIRTSVASRCPQRPSLAALISFSTSAGVTYSRVRNSALGGRNRN